MVKQDENGKLVNSPEELLELYLRTYKDRLKHRGMNPKYFDMKKLKEKLWKNINKLIKERKTSPWTMENLDVVLRNLKNNKTKDPSGIIN